MSNLTTLGRTQEPDGRGKSAKSKPPPEVRETAARTARGGSTAPHVRQAIEERLRIQPRLSIGATHDPLEREADRVADRVMRMPDPGSQTLQRKCDCGGTCPKCQEAVQMSSAGPGTQAGMQAPPSVHEVLESPGQPLDGSTRAFFEPRFGQDFSQVRVHSGKEAESSTQDVNAHAFTVGNNIVFGAGQQPSGRLLAHELTHVVQQRSGQASGPMATLQRDPKDTQQGSGSTAAAPAGPRQRVYIVRDQSLGVGGGTLVNDLEDFKSRVMSATTDTEWTLVLHIHGSEEKLGAQSPPDWQKNAKFYEPAAIDKLFNGDDKFVKWRDKYGPTRLSMVSCQVSASFEKTLIANLTRPFKDGQRHEGIGLGAGCKPIAHAETVPDAPNTQAEFDRLTQPKKDAIVQKLGELNKEWGYYGAPPVPNDQLLHYYYDEDPKGYWVKVEVMTGTGHTVAELKATGIPFWNRSSGPKGAQFRDLCDQGVHAGKREHTPAVPDVPDSP